LERHDGEGVNVVVRGIDVVIVLDADMIQFIGPSQNCYGLTNGVVEMGMPHFMYEWLMSYSYEWCI
jgi:hypothetical protein